MLKRTLFAVLSLSVLYTPTHASWQAAAKEAWLAGSTAARRHGNSVPVLRGVATAAHARRIDISWPAPLWFVPPVRTVTTVSGLTDDEAAREEHEFADPTSDFSFKAMFRRTENKDILRNFLNNILDRKGENEIIELTIQDADADPHYEDVKKFSFDIFCKDKAGEQYIIEMEKDAFKQHSRAGFFKRLQAYTGRAYSEQIVKGTSYKKLNPVICVVLANTKVFEHEDKARYLSRHKILDEQTGEHHFRDMMWVVVEIPKFNKKEDELVTELDQWMDLFRNAKNRRHVPVKVRAPEVRRAYEVLDKATWSEEERIAAMREDFARHDRESIAIVAEERGEARGREEGREEGLAKGLAEGAQAKLRKVVTRLASAGQTSGEIAELLDEEIATVTALLLEGTDPSGRN